MDARAIPFANEFDLVGLFDVLEHIEEDEKVLLQIFEAVRAKSGGLILTVPQHRFLWSYADEFACHCRRYSKTELCSKVEKAGFEVTFVSSFVSLLLPLMLISRLTKGNPKDYSLECEFKMPTWLNRAFEIAMQIERTCVQAGLRLPLGGASRCSCSCNYVLAPSDSSGRELLYFRLKVFKRKKPRTTSRLFSIFKCRCYCANPA